MTQHLPLFSEQTNTDWCCGSLRIHEARGRRERERQRETKRNDRWISSCGLPFCAGYISSITRWGFQITLDERLLSAVGVSRPPTLVTLSVSSSFRGLLSLGWLDSSFLWVALLLTTLSPLLTSSSPKVWNNLKCELFQVME